MSTTHGHRRTHVGSPTYRSWATMIQRCTNPRVTSFPNYGARGIKVCRRWRAFKNFLADMGERPDGTTLDRFPNNDGDYAPGNCRWATKQQQAENSRKSRQITFKGETHGVREWARRLGIGHASLSRRLARLSVAEALTLPKRAWPSQGKAHG